MSGVEEGWALYALYAGTAASAVGAVASATASSNAAKYNQQVAEQNAQSAAAQGQAAAEAQSRDAQRQQGAAIASYGASGVDASTGSPADVLSMGARNATLDNLTTKYNYKLKELGYQDDASLDEANATNATTSGYLNAAGSSLSGGANAYYKINGTGN